MTARTAADVIYDALSGKFGDFCGGHADAALDALRAEGWAVVDMGDRMEAKQQAHEHGEAWAKEYTAARQAEAERDEARAEVDHVRRRAEVERLRLRDDLAGARAAIARVRGMIRRAQTVPTHYLDPDEVERALDGGDA